MKLNVQHKIAILMAVLMALPVHAAQDEFQKQFGQRMAQSRAKLQQAEAAKGEERQKLMAEHMKMMQENMEKMQAMRPKAGMSQQEADEWVSQHQKLMADMMGQMMGEHSMMNQMMGGQHKSGMMGGQRKMDQMDGKSGGAAESEHKH